MTALAELVKRHISASGPMTVEDFMKLALMHPDHGYYTKQDPLGADGDFTTAPEISQMFGELVGLALAQAWLDQGAPAPFNLVELGPGRGTLMKDVLRATSQVPGFAEAAEVHLVEASPVLRRKQVETIGANVTLHDLLDEVPVGPMFLIANEFFDALPVRQFIRDGASWRERVVGLNGDALMFGLTEPMALESLAHRIEDTRDGDLVEVCRTGEAIAGTIGTKLEPFGGAALIIDYGDWRSLGDTLQALRQHETVDALDAPGTADLTCHVDFEALAKAAHPAKASRLTTQGVFLERLGITARATALAKNLSGSALESHIAAHRRLTHPDEMGTVFKVLGLFPEAAPPPPGLET